MTHFFEMSSGEDFSDGLHECISYDDGDITSRVSIISKWYNFGENSKRKYLPICELGKRLEILRRKSVRCGANIQLEHPSSSVDIWERNVDTFLESGSQHPRRTREAIGRVR